MPKRDPVTGHRVGVKRPGRGRGGRTPGTTNRWNRDVKDAVLETFELLGGVPGLVKWARRNQKEFYRGFFKLLPRELTGKDGQPLIPPELVSGITRRVIDVTPEVVPDKDDPTSEVIKAH